ncbi:hypothetical protein ACAW74_04335 [Fibrella sp. WM1]|uniref:hypothetical protein n=1 Tax=Fibrella musci TaxID=3242485 RepID=UPI00351FFD74
MAQPSQFATALIDETVQTFNGDVKTVSPTDGINLIDHWISALHSGDESTNPVAHTLSELKMQLQEGTPNSGTVLSLIQELADQTHQAAQQVDGDEQQALAQLASSLRGFGQHLSGGSNQSAQSRQGDMDDPTGSNGGQLSSDISDAGTTGAYSSDNSDMGGAPTTGSQSVGGDRYGQ